MIARKTDGAGRRGQALIMALIVMLMALPVAFYFCQYVAETVKAAVADREQKNASELADDVVTDYFRQFSQDPYNGHYDEADLERPDYFYSAGYSTVTFTADSVHHTLYLRAEGVAGSTATAAGTHERVLEALIQFVSPLALYGSMFNSATTLSGGSGTVYDGGFYVNGKFTLQNAGTVFVGGPVVVNGNLSGNATIDGDLYYSGASKGAFTVDGSTYNFIPQITWPTLDFSYYEAYSTYITTSSVSVQLNSNKTYTIGGTDYSIPASGAIIFANNADVTVSGAVSGMVTVVAGDSTNGGCSSPAGIVDVSGGVYYVGASSISANSGESFAALATNCINFYGSPNSGMTAVGIYFVQNGTANMNANCGCTYNAFQKKYNCSGCFGNQRFSLYGTRDQAINDSFPKFSAAYDPNLRSFQPPGLPEYAYLVNWNLHH